MIKKIIFVIGVIFLLGFVVRTFFLENYMVSIVIDAPKERKLNEIFPVTIAVSELKVPVNVFQADLEYDPKKLEALSFNTDNSLLTVLLQKEIDNEHGFVRLTGGVHDAGFSESYGVLGEVYFRATAPGTTDIKLLSSSSIFASDGKGTDLRKKHISASLVISPQEFSGANSAQSLLGAQSNSSQIDFSEPGVLGDATYLEIQESKKNILQKNWESFLTKFTQK